MTQTITETLNGVTNGHSIHSHTNGKANAYGPTYTEAEDLIPASEYQERIEKVRAALPAAGLVGLVAFGDCWRGSNICYFTEFRPMDGVSDIANGLFFLGVDAEPALFVSKQCVAFASECTTFPVYSFDELKERLGAFAANHTGTIGLAGHAYIPADLLRRVEAAVGGMPIEPSKVLAEIKAVKSDREVALILKACKLTDAAMIAIRETLKDGKPHTERELALIGDMAMLAGGADRTAFDSMVQAGPRSGFNTARPTDRVLQPGDLVMTDIVCV